MNVRRSVRIVGPGRAGGAMARALADIGWQVLEPVDRSVDPTEVGLDVDLVLIATPDAAIAEVARAIEPSSTTVVAHLSGASGPAVLAPHPHRAAIHPLTSMPTADIGALRLRRSCWFALDAETPESMDCLESIVRDLGGRSFRVDESRRANYHAAAAIASNHVVALLGSAERVAADAGVPIEAYLELVRATIDNIEDLGVADALTGPVARGDWDTVARHRAAIDPSELELYDALVEATRRVVDSSTQRESSLPPRPTDS